MFARLHKTSAASNWNSVIIKSISAYKLQVCKYWSLFSKMQVYQDMSIQDQLICVILIIAKQCKSSHGKHTVCYRMSTSNWCLIQTNGDKLIN